MGGLELTFEVGLHSFDGGWSFGQPEVLAGLEHFLIQGKSLFRTAVEDKAVEQVVIDTLEVLEVFLDFTFGLGFEESQLEGILAIEDAFEEGNNVFGLCDSLVEVGSALFYEL